MRPIAAIKARVWIAQGNLAEAADWARERGVSVTDDASYLREFDHLTLVRLLLARHRADHDSGVARPGGRPVGPAARGRRDLGRAGSLLEIRMLQALVHDAQGRRPQALESLAQALAAGARTRRLRPALPGRGCSDAEPAARRQAGRRRRRPGASPAPRRRPQSRRPAPNTGQGVAQTAVESLSDRELQVLRLLDSELSGPEIARELFVSHNTVRTHTKHIFTKLDVTTRRAAVLRARERGLI